MKIIQKRSIYIILAMMVFLLAACGSSGKDELTDTGESDHAERSASPLEPEAEEENSEVPEEKKQEVPSQKAKFGSVPWFQDDTGKNTQLHDGYLYAYWGSRLCRYDVETLEETVLYEATSVQNGDFCVHEGYVYFLVRHDVTFLDGPVTMLYRVGCDGTGLTKLQELQTEKEYSLDVYGDILYLFFKCYNRSEKDNIYLRIREDGVEQVLERETLYGMLPEGFDAEQQLYRHRNMPSLPYAMRNFGYMFLWDAEERLFRYDPVSKDLEQLDLPEKARMLYLTNDSILFQDGEDIWNRASLDDPTKILRIPASCFEKGGELYRELCQYADELGMYFVERGVGYINLTRVSWEGECEHLYTALERRNLTTALNYDEEVALDYLGGGYLYYNSVTQGDGVILRVPLEREVPGAEWEPEQFAVYYESPIKDISRKEKVVTEFHSYKRLSGTFTVEEIRLTDGSKASEKINQSLDKVYVLWQEQILEYEQVIRDNEDYQTWDDEFVTVYFDASIAYLDQDYICFRFAWQEFWDGAYHPMQGAQFMVFDRKTARRVSLEEYTGLSGEELCRIIAPYVEMEADWAAERPNWDILEDGRFFLSREGIGIHYDVYEIGNYVGGDRDIVVPYEAFLK